MEYAGLHNVSFVSALCEVLSAAEVLWADMFVVELFLFRCDYLACAVVIRIRCLGVVATLLRGCAGVSFDSALILNLYMLVCLLLCWVLWLLGLVWLPIAAWFNLGVWVYFLCFDVLGWEIVCGA